MNKLIEPVEFKSTKIPLTKDDEYDTDKLCGIVEQHRRVMSRAEYGGTITFIQQYENVDGGTADERAG